jgi:hypothetical protein
MAPNDASKTPKVFTLDDIATADGTRYETVEAHGGEWKIATLSTAHVLDWSERRRANTPNAKVNASMFLIARSLVFGDLNDPASLVRVPDERVQEVADEFAKKDDTENGKLVNKILALNDFLKKPADDKGSEGERGNGSGEATPAASPIA